MIIPVPSVYVYLLLPLLYQGDMSRQYVYIVSTYLCTFFHGASFVLNIFIYF